MSIVERAVRALERGGVSRVFVVAPRGASGEPLFRSLPGLVGGRLRVAVTERSRGIPRLPEGPVLVLLRPVVLDPAAIVELARGRPRCDPHESEDPPRAAAPGGWTAFVAEPAPGRSSEFIRSILERGEPPRFARVRRLEASAAPVFQPVSNRRERRAAESALRRSLIKPTDGFFAAWIDRRISTRLSLRLADAGVSPNAITLAGLAPALAGALLFALPGTLWPVLGALLYWSSTVLDGCDGEVARLTYRESAGGARLDLLCDNAALLALFGGICVHAYRERPGPTVPLLALSIAVGMAGCMTTEYLRILRPRIRSDAASRPAADLSPERVRWYERLASRDFAYLLPFLAAFGALRHLVWAAAIGVHVFWLALAGWVLRPRRKVT